MASLAHSINSTDRLGVTLLIATVVHTLIILGVTFNLPDPKVENSEKNLDIIVVRNQQKSENNKEADFLAQASQQGGGTLKEKKRLTEKTTTPTLKPKPVKRVQQTVNMPPPKPQTAKKVLVAKKSSKKQASAPKKVAKKPKTVTMQQLLASTQQEIDLLTAELDTRSQRYSKQPRRKHINSSTQEYKYASYLAAWRKKVEDIGNLNYPDEAKRRKIYGNILMTVVLKPDGSVSKIRIKKRSGHKILDDAAVRIVKLAAPFSPFPKNIRSETDELVITRTWQFVSGNKLFTNN